MNVGNQQDEADSSISTTSSSSESEQTPTNDATSNRKWTQILLSLILSGVIGVRFKYSFGKNGKTEIECELPAKHK